MSADSIASPGDLVVLGAEGSSELGLIIAVDDERRVFETVAAMTAGVGSGISLPGDGFIAPLPASYEIDLASRKRHPVQSLHSLVGTLRPEVLEAVLRAMVQKDVRLYFEGSRAPKLLEPFSPGDRIPYAGRVYDASDMASLTDSCLDFWLTSGRFAEKFEQELARILGVRFAAAVNSGSSANLLALSSLASPLLKERRLRPGDEVITVAAGFPTTVTPIIQNGCVSVFVDVTVDDGTYNVDVAQLEEAVSPKTKAVMLAHTLGNPFNIDAVLAICSKHNLWLIEDNCDALGSTYRGTLTGTFGDLGTSSFYPPHHITMGEGGAVYSNHKLLKRIIESFRDWGRDCWCAPGKDDTCGKRFGQQLGTLPKGYDHKYTYRHFGYNFKITDMQAAVGCAQLQKLDAFTAARKRNWKFLRESLDELSDRFILPEATPNSDPSWFGFLLTVRKECEFTRDEIVKWLEQHNIQTRMLFAGNLLRQPCFDEMRNAAGAYRVVGNLSNTDRIMNDTFWVGVYPGLKEGMLEYMVSSIASFIRR